MRFEAEAYYKLVAGTCLMCVSPKQMGIDLSDPHQKFPRSAGGQSSLHNHNLQYFADSYGATINKLSPRHLSFTGRPGQ